MLLSPKDLLTLKIAARNWQSLNDFSATEVNELISNNDELPTDSFLEKQPPELQA